MQTFTTNPSFQQLNFDYTILYKAHQESSDNNIIQCKFVLRKLVIIFHLRKTITLIH